MVNLVAVIRLVYLCAVHQVYSDVLTNIKTEAGVSTLLTTRRIFYISDYDDDNILSFKECLRFIDENDMNNDGTITYKEYISIPGNSGIPYSLFQKMDASGDGVINTRDIKILFEFLPGSGNKIDLQEYLTIRVSKIDVTFGPIMKIQSFVQAERDFLIIDENDDNILTRQEFQVEFRIADQNKNGNLEESEVRNMFPMRSTPPECICPNITVSCSCSVDDVLLLFDTADTDNTTELNVEEYIQYFGTLIVNY